MSRETLEQPLAREDFDFNQLFPYAAYNTYREKSPVIKVRGYGWLVTGHPEVAELLQHPKILTVTPSESAKQMVLIGKNKVVSTLLSPLLGFLIQRNNFVKMTKNWLIFSNPPDHNRMRRIMNIPFKPKEIRKIEQQVDRMASEMVEAITVDENGAFELISQFAFPFPMHVIAAILGIPDQDMEQFRVWSELIISALSASGFENRELLKTAETARKELFTYLNQLIERKRLTNDDDMISMLINLEEASLSNEEIISNAVLLIIAGHETSVNLIGNMLYQIVDHGLIDQIRQEQNYEKIVEEALRIDPPIPMLLRQVGENLEFHGHQLKRGDFLTLSIYSSNHDPRVFPEPESFDPDRSNSRSHLSFGKGIHFCLGAPLARIEAKFALKYLLERFSSLSFVDKDAIRRRPLYGFSSFERLDLTRQ